MNEETDENESMKEFSDVFSRPIFPPKERIALFSLLSFLAGKFNKEKRAGNWKFFEKLSPLAVRLATMTHFLRTNKNNFPSFKKYFPRFVECVKFHKVQY